MADIITINTRDSWSAGTWIARFVVRAIHGFLPRCDAAHIADQFERFQAGHKADLSHFESADMLIVYHAASHAHAHVTAFGLVSEVFIDSAFTPDESFLMRFSAKFGVFIDMLARDPRVRAYLTEVQLHH